MVMEPSVFRGCQSSAFSMFRYFGLSTHGVKMRVLGSMTMHEISDRIGKFTACVDGRRFSWGKEDRVCDVFGYEDEEECMPSPSQKSLKQ